MRPERIDGHIWLDPQNAIVIVRRMTEELTRVDPAHAGSFAENAKATIARLQALDQALEARLAPLRAKPFVVFHDAYQYFERRYGLAGAGALAINPELQPSARKLKTLRDTLVAENVACAFAEPEFEPKLMITLTEGTPTRRATLDPEGAALAPGPDLYFTLLDNLASALANCLQAPASAAP
jgi:zinc transport system substrate-binding protein